jgi:hypothetical protein
MEGDHHPREQGGAVRRERFPSCLGFAVVEMAVLPVQPGMAKFMREDIASPGDRKFFPEINRLELVVPNAIGIGITAVHLAIRELPDGDPIPEG